MIDFYDQLSPFYHLIYEDWEASIAWQAERLSRIIRARWGEQVESVLDVSCGIGTQSLGLARLRLSGHRLGFVPGSHRSCPERGRST